MVFPPKQSSSCASSVLTRSLHQPVQTGPCITLSQLGLSSTTHSQKDLRLALALGDQLGQPLPVAAAANELFKAAKAKGKGDEDFAAVYEATQI